MKKIDKLVLGAFVSPFFLTFLVVVFILLNIQMLKYFDDLIGKGLEWTMVAQLLFYFAIFTTPTALPLAVLLSSLIAFGNLGEHFELTAIKSAGISLVRILRPIFFFVLLLTGGAFYANNYLVPKAALEAYSLLYDIKQKKPALDLREGSFYNGINDISIKVDKKFPEDEAALKNIIVYDHRKNDGNKEVTVADSGRMSTILNDRYLKFELFKGYNYKEGTGDRDLTGSQGYNQNKETLSRSKFDKMQVIFDLSSFKMERTDKKWFQNNRIMRNLSELEYDMDSLDRDILAQRLYYYQYKPAYFNYYFKNDTLILPKDVYNYKRYRDSIISLPYKASPVDAPVVVDSTPAPEVKNDFDRELEGRPRPNAFVARNKKSGKPIRQKVLKDEKALAEEKIIVTRRDYKKLDSIRTAKLDSIFNRDPSVDILQGATNMARQVKSQVMNVNTTVDNIEKERIGVELQWHSIIARSLACIAMFLIGAPLGAIIKKGGLGMPFLVSILFFIVYYVITMQGEKLAKQGTVAPYVGVWMADFLLFIIGFFFLRQARADARLFEADFYNVVFEKIKRWINTKKNNEITRSAV